MTGGRHASEGSAVAERDWQREGPGIIRDHDDRRQFRRLHTTAPSRLTPLRSAPSQYKQEHDPHFLGVVGDACGK
ncbi:hypothetical protein E2C01_073016 [Portunus trituberculatus]|uniref:Uncharacterized protein n=1 Tax=Portunus trituberculatus TaxID=210409 RepID=A0A5B7IC82_PORTR|nr:hypothetical protein [Portunus trituberculatus]